MGKKKDEKPRIGRPVKREGEISTKEKIFDAAVNLFSKQGYEKTSVREIASILGLTEGAVYRHYTNKEAILDEIFIYAEKMIFSPLPIEQTLGMLQGMSIFRGLLAPLPEIIMAEPYVVKIMRIMFHEIYYNEKIRNYYLIEYKEKGDEHINIIFEKCIELGTIIKCDSRLLSRVFNSYRADWAFHNFIIQHDKPLDMNKLRTELDEIITFFEGIFLPKQTEK